MTRTLTITVNEWEAVRDGHLWIVRDGCTRSSYPFEDDTPPADLLAAAAPCDRCRSARIDRSFYFGEDRPCLDCRITLVGECPHDCKRFYGKVPGYLRGSNWAWVPCWCDGTGTVTLGCAYPASEVLPVFDRYGVCDVGLPEEWMPHITIDADFGEVLACTRDPKYRNEWLEVSIDLAHYGDPAGLVGKWALQLAVEP